MSALFAYPKQAEFGRVLPKNKIYEHSGANKPEGNSLGNAGKLNGQNLGFMRSVANDVNPSVPPKYLQKRAFGRVFLWSTPWSTRMPFDWRCHSTSKPIRQEQSICFGHDLAIQNLLLRVHDEHRKDCMRAIARWRLKQPRSTLTTPPAGSGH